MAKRLVPLANEYNIQIDEDVFNEVYLPYLYLIFRIMIFYGGSSSGKSFFISQMLALQLTMFEGRNLIALRHQDKDCKESCFPQIVKALEQLKLIDFWIVKEHPSPRLINRINGNEIAFTGLDDVENIKSITFKKGNVTDFWVEEANEIESVKDIRELNRRLRGLGPAKRIIISFNPILRTHWLFDYVNKEIKTKNHMMLKTTFRDNRFLTDEDRSELEALQYVSPYEWQVYGLGEWGTTGQSVFNANAIHSRLLELRSKHEIEQPTHIEFAFKRDDNGLPNKDSFVPFINEDGEITIFKEPEPNIPYVMAIDTAEGGNDFYTTQVLNNITGEQVAVYHSQQNEEHTVLQAYALAQYYNNALVCPEANVGSYTIKTFVALGYPYMYQRVTGVENIHQNNELKLGFRTTVGNRKQILTELQTWANANMNLINDPLTLNEMLTFTRQAKKLQGIFWSAENGAHDDLVMALAIALQAREQQVGELQAPKIKLKGEWFAKELELMEKEGKITKQDAMEYRKVNGVIGKPDRIFNVTQRRNKYDR